jgi:hypothetical protein
MKIELQRVKIRHLVKEYKNNQEEGVVGFGGKLNIRPKYQREFIYKQAQQQAVIETVRKSFPLNVMYWVENEEGFEVLDGQQRTLSICNFIQGEFSIDQKSPKYYSNLTKEEQDQILDYELMVYFCSGNEREKLDWFETINIAGEKLTKQELRNAVYTGSWLSDAKRYFSKTNCPAFNLGKDLVNGSPIRQDYLETALSWISNGDINEYMSKHQNKPNANELWLYFNQVINWVNTLFPNYRREMKGNDWGLLYNLYNNREFDSKLLESQVKKLMQDEDVTKKSGIYDYLITDKEKHLSIRSFSMNQRREAYERQQGVCPSCSGKFEVSEMEGDHITPWRDGGKSTAENCQMLCKGCNRTKGAK